MKCSFPPPPSEDQLSAALDGDAAETDHFERCPACAARLRSARGIEGKLVNTLYRADCPSSQQLGDYHLGMLGQSNERYIERHLHLCALCHTELEELRIYVIAGVKEPTPVLVPVPERRRPAHGRWTELVARLIPRTPGLALRGAAGGPIMAEAGGTTLVVDVQPAGSDVTIIGQVVSDDPDRWTGALVELRRDGTLLAAAGVDDLGSFVFGVAPGTATLRVTPEYGPAIVLQNVVLHS